MQDALKILSSGVVPKRNLETAEGRWKLDPEKLREHRRRANAKRPKEKRRRDYNRYMTSVPVPGGKRPWEDWEKQFVLDHPSPYWTAREIALALNRSLRAVLDQRIDPDGSKRRSRYLKARQALKANAWRSMLPHPAINPTGCKFPQGRLHGQLPFY